MKFKEFGLEPFEGAYYHNFNQTIYSINENTIRLELYNSNNANIAFTYGEGFQEHLLFNDTLQLPIYFEPASKDCILVVKDFNTIKDFKENDNIKGILLVSDIARRSIAKSKKEHDLPTFIISEETYEILQNNQEKSLVMSLDYEVKDLKENNIMGLIPGRNANKLILISAHLDHVGSVGDNIWRGAIDNASGISVLLDLAKNINATIKNNELNVDIIFTAFNNEEGGLVGSQFASKYLDDIYSEIININLDCIGEKNKELLIDRVSNEASKKLATTLKKSFERDDIVTAITEGQFLSDHISFSNSINISTNIKNSPIHTLDDTIDKLDIEYMSQISDILVKAIIEYGEQFESVADIEGQKRQELFNKLEKERGKLNYSEYKRIIIDDEDYLVINPNFSGDIEELYEIYDEDFSFVPIIIQGNKLEKIELRDFSINESRIYVDELELDKIYKIDLSTLKDYIDAMYLDYNDDNPGASSIKFNIYDKNNAVDMMNYNYYIEGNNIKISEENMTELDKFDFYFQKPENNQAPSLLYIQDYNTNIFTVSIEVSNLEIENSEDFVEFVTENQLEKFIEEALIWLGWVY